MDKFLASASRLGVRGTEDLGQGWSANFVFEAGARIDTGQADVNNSDAGSGERAWNAGIRHTF